MIQSHILGGVRNGTCAVGYLTVPLEAYLEDPLAPFFKVVGTGFLARSESAMSNRHVLEALAEAQADLGFPDKQRVVVFVAPGERDPLQVTIRMIRRLGVLSDPDLDVGFIDFQREPEAQLVSIQPLTIRDHWDTRVSEPVAVCGYPYGHALLQRRGRVHRWGPVVQQGHVSAVSPFDTFDPSKMPTDLLLDVRVATGMSGAPIFRPEDGVVIGIVHTTWEATTALGLALTRSTVDKWLTEYDSTQQHST